MKFQGFQVPRDVSSILISLKEVMIWVPTSPGISLFVSKFGKSCSDKINELI